MYSGCITANHNKATIPAKYEADNVGTLDCCILCEHWSYIADGRGTNKLTWRSFEKFEPFLNKITREVVGDVAWEWRNG